MPPSLAECTEMRHFGIKIQKKILGGGTAKGRSRGAGGHGARQSERERGVREMGDDLLHEAEQACRADPEG